jgi:hypothetical protein
LDSKINPCLLGFSVISVGRNLPSDFLLRSAPGDCELDDGTGPRPKLG